MGERLMAKLDRLGAEASIKQMTPEIYRFSMLVRSDVVAQWPQREWVGLNDEEMQAVVDAQLLVSNINVYFKAIEAKLKEKNNGTTS